MSLSFRTIGSRSCIAGNQKKDLRRLEAHAIPWRDLEVTEPFSRDCSAPCAFGVPEDFSVSKNARHEGSGRGVDFFSEAWTAVL